MTILDANLLLYINNSDAPQRVVAAMAMENGAQLASTDQDFRRFPELRWINPL
jgi:predicted nucleic acid-binding protein